MLRRLRKLLVQEVPEELAVCMFECTESQCTPRQWAVCELRTRGTQGQSTTFRTAPARSTTAVQPLNIRMLPRRG